MFLNFIKCNHAVYIICLVSFVLHYFVRFMLSQLICFIADQSAIVECTPVYLAILLLLNISVVLSLGPLGIPLLWMFFYVCPGALGSGFSRNILRDNRECILLALLDNAKQFFKVVVQTYTPSSSVE